MQTHPRHTSAVPLLPHGHHPGSGHLGLLPPTPWWPPPSCLPLAAAATFLFPECAGLTLTPRSLHLLFPLPGNPQPAARVPGCHLSVVLSQLRCSFREAPRPWSSGGGRWLSFWGCGRGFLFTACGLRACPGHSWLSRCAVCPAQRRPVVLMPSGMDEEGGRGPWTPGPRGMWRLSSEAGGPMGALTVEAPGPWAGGGGAGAQALALPRSLHGEHWGSRRWPFPWLLLAAPQSSRRTADRLSREQIQVLGGCLLRHPQAPWHPSRGRLWGVGTRTLTHTHEPSSVCVFL